MAIADRFSQRYALLDWSWNHEFRKVFLELYLGDFGSREGLGQLDP